MSLPIICWFFWYTVNLAFLSDFPHNSDWKPDVVEEELQSL